MSWSMIIVIVLIVGVLGWVIAQYNTLINMIEAIKNNFKQIDIQLDRRYKVFESLINVVKKYMDYEKTVLKDVVELRNQAQKASQVGDVQKQIEAENQISKIASGINVVFENYPDLKASQNVLQLQEEIVNTENKLTYAKQAYNDSIERYNAFKQQFLEAIVVAIFRAKLDKNFEYWGISEEQVKAHEEYTVKL